MSTPTHADARKARHRARTNPARKYLSERTPRSADTRLSDLIDRIETLPPHAVVVMPGGGFPQDFVALTHGGQVHLRTGQTPVTVAELLTEARSAVGREFELAGRTATIRETDRIWIRNPSHAPGPRVLELEDYGDLVTFATNPAAAATTASCVDTATDQANRFPR